MANAVRKRTQEDIEKRHGKSPMSKIGGGLSSDGDPSAGIPLFLQRQAVSAVETDLVQRQDLEEENSAPMEEREDEEPALAEDIEPGSLQRQTEDEGIRAPLEEPEEEEGGSTALAGSASLQRQVEGEEEPLEEPEEDLSTTPSESVTLQRQAEDEGGAPLEEPEEEESITTAPTGSVSLQRQVEGEGEEAIEEPEEESVSTTPSEPLSLQRQAGSEGEETLDEREEESVSNTPSEPVALQRQAENRKEEPSEELEEEGGVRAKLTIGRPGDEYEQEADQVADVVARAPQTGLEGSPMGDLAPEEEEERPTVQPKADAATPRGTTTQLHRAVRSPGPGAPMPDRVRKKIEPVLGADLKNVHVHTDAEAYQAAKSIKAKAFTHKDHIWLGRGQSPEDANLMAHEATHVVQQSSRGGVVQAKHKPSHMTRFLKTGFGQLGREVKKLVDRMLISRPTQTMKYPWERKQIREIVYPHRATMLRKFLLTEYEIDLWRLQRQGRLEGYLKGKSSGIETALKMRKAELTRLKKSRKSTRRAYVRAVRERWAHRRGFRRFRRRTPSVRRAETRKRTSSKRLRKLRREVRNLISRAQWYRHNKPQHRRRLKVEVALATKVAQMCLASLDTIAAKASYGLTLEPYERKRRAIEKRIKSARDKHEVAKRDLRALSRRRRTSRAEKTVAAAISYALDSRRKRLLKLNHRQLLQRVLRRFKADPRVERFPPWLRHMVVHFSGMRYAIAHGSWASPHTLLGMLRADVIKKRMKEIPNDLLVKLADEATTDLTIERMALASALSILGAAKASKRLRRALRHRLRAIERMLEKLKGPYEVYERLSIRYRRYATELQQIGAMEHNRQLLESECDHAIEIGDKETYESKKETLSACERNIKRLMRKLPRYIRRKLIRKLRRAESVRHKAVRGYQLKKATREIKALSDPYALALLEEVARDAPDWVRKLVVSHTRLRLTMPLPGGKTGDWENLTREERKARAKKDPATKRWRRIMYRWKRDFAAWRRRHASTLDIIVLRAVCNEIAEHALHARGLKPRGGLTGKVQWYQKMERRMPMAFFGRAKDIRYFPSGASIFWLGWSKNPPSGSNIARRIPKESRKTPGGKPLDKSGEVREVVRKKGKTVTWIYRYDQAKSTFYCQRADDKTKKYWYKWTHEAIVYRTARMGSEDKVITFETTPTGAGIREHDLKRLLKSNRVFIGYVESDKPHPRLNRPLLGLPP